MKKRKYTRYYVSIAIVLAVFLLSIVPLLRTNHSFAGEEAYMLLRMAENQGFYDALSFGGRFAPYALGTASILKPNPELLGYALPFIAGMLCLLLFLGILKKFEIKERGLAIILFVLSPSFIYLFGTLNQLLMPVVIVLLAFFVMLRDGKISYLSVPLFAILPFFNFIVTLIALFMAFLLVHFKLKGKSAVFYSSLGLTLLTGLGFLGYIYKNAGFESLLFTYGKTGINGAVQRLFAEMGGKYGLSIFGSILAIFGIINNWKKKYKDLFVFFSVFALFILMLFRVEAIIFMNLFIAVFAAKGFTYFLNARWEAKNLRFFIILTFICGILFITAAEENRIIDENPNLAMIEGMEFLEKLPSGTVFSDYSRGFWINYAGKTNVMDSNFKFAPDVNERWKDSQTLFFTRDWKTAKSIIEKYEIKYVWIDEMLKQKIWNDEVEGLLFLAKYGKNLKKVYDNTDMHEEMGVRIWEFQEE